MVDALVHPINIFLLGLGGGFLIPLLYKIGKPLPAIGGRGAMSSSRSAHGPMC